MLRPLPWTHRNLSKINSIAVATSRMSAAPNSPSEIWVDSDQATLCECDSVPKPRLAAELRGLGELLD